MTGLVVSYVISPSRSCGKARLSVADFSALRAPCVSVCMGSSK